MVTKARNKKAKVSGQSGQKPAEGQPLTSPPLGTLLVLPILPGRHETDDTGRTVKIEPPQPCPELLTEEEAARYLRLDVKNRGDTLRYYRENYGLRAVQISRRVLYPREQLDALWRRLMEENPR